MAINNQLLTRDIFSSITSRKQRPGIKTNAVRLNKELHFSIYDAAAMPMLTKIIETMWLRVGPILNYDLRIGSERTLSKIAVKHHKNLIEALALRDPSLARQALCADIESAFKSIYKKQYLNGKETYPSL
jgi:DNA-binding GntR family transcriptional regulator